MSNTSKEQGMELFKKAIVETVTKAMEEFEHLPKEEMPSMWIESVYEPITLAEECRRFAAYTKRMLAVASKNRPIVF